MLEEGRSWRWRPFLLGSSGWDLVFFIGGEEMEEAVEVGEEERTEVAAAVLALAVAVAERLVGRDMKVIKRRALSSEAEKRKF